MKKSLGNVYLALVFVFLYAPIVTLIVYSFNAGKGRKWVGFSLEWYQELFESDMIMSAVGNTLSIALLSALAATVIGVVSCLGIHAMRGKKRDLYMALNNVPLLNSDLVTGLSLMLVFILFGITFGYGSVLLAHISFNIPYVILSVLPRLRQMNYSIYEAAVDLGAKPVKAFWKVVVPDLLPAVISGFLMAFTMSLDDFIVTHFTKGPGINTISTLIYSEVRVGINPAMNALSAIMFLSAIVLLVLTNLRGTKEE
ncbi:MAG: ABC transporter permease [Lachnospiraceae bacterium]|nr:ABC transporter permease [Lachnospiraceae bacterium]